MSTIRPFRRTGVIAKDIDGETWLYSADGEAIHILNATAKVIWGLCDGEHSVDDMVQEMKTRFSATDEHDLTRDIRLTLEAFFSKELLQNTV